MSSAAKQKKKTKAVNPTKQLRLNKEVFALAWDGQLDAHQLKRLRKAGADIDRQHADRKGCALLDAGADRELQAISGDAALHDTSREGHDVCVGLLLVAGAEVNARTEQGFTPLMFCSW
jgi:ankyrin repeat protein